MEIAFVPRYKEVFIVKDYYEYNLPKETQIVTITFEILPSLPLRSYYKYATLKKRYTKKNATLKKRYTKKMLHRLYSLQVYCLFLCVYKFIIYRDIL